MTAVATTPSTVTRAVWVPSVEGAATNPSAAVAELVEQLPDLLTSLRRLESLVAARTAETLARLTVEFDHLDAGHALRPGRGAAAVGIVRSTWLLETVPVAHAALTVGDLSALQARICFDVLGGTEPGVAQAVLTRTLPKADCSAGELASTAHRNAHRG